MSLGAITIKATRQTVDGGLEVLMTVVGDDSYPAGGTPGFNASLRDALIAWEDAKPDANVRGYQTVSTMYLVPRRNITKSPSYDYDADKLYVWDMTTGPGGSEQAPGDISTTTFEFVAVCK